MEDSGNEITTRLLELRRAVQSKIKQLKRTIEKQNSELTEAKGWSLQAQLADSLLSAQHLFPRGSQQCTIINAHTQSEVALQLNPRLDACENAQLLYKKARKGKRGQEIIEEKLAQTQNTLGQLELLSQRIALVAADTMLSAEQLEAAADELLRSAAGQGIATRHSASHFKEDERPRYPYRHFTVDGYDVFVGRNNEQNDELTTRFTKPWDIWMHVTPHAGSHVVIRRNKNAPWPAQGVIVKVAALTVWFSKAKHVTSADVHVTEGRFVHKPRHSAPGQVVAERCKTVHVKPLSPQELFGRHSAADDD